MHLKRRLLVGLLYLVTAYALVSAEAIETVERSGTITGRVIDQNTGSPIEYATVALMQSSDNMIVTGTITDESGQFRISGIRNGAYYLEVSFMGFEKQRIESVSIKEGHYHVNIGSIELNPTSESLSEVEIVADRKAFEYKIDKKIVNVGKQFTAASMTAIEVLENIPSVKVDIEGNVSLRGSTGFTVLVDGKPSILDPSDALRQIPASSIENIEIITNPSAKYQPDGTAGIINVITKKNKISGINGQLNLNTGMHNKYGGEILLNYRVKKVNLNLGADYNSQTNPGESSSERITYQHDTAFFTNALGHSERKFERWGIKTGIEYDINEKNNLALAGRFGGRSMGQTGIFNYHEFSDPVKPELFYTSKETGDRNGNFYSITGNYQHLFDKNGHDLKIQADRSRRTGDDKDINLLLNEMNSPVEGMRNTESGPSVRTEIRMDYTRPFSEKSKLEAGFQGRYENSDENNLVDSLNINTHEFEPLTYLSNSANYKQHISGIYTTYSTSIKRLGIQLGLRGEYTYRLITTVKNDNRFSIDDIDYFPTLHFSYSMPGENQLMMSYARRIERPRGFFLEPFLTYTDAYNVRQGNPDLKPEYIDSYEMGYLKQFQNAFVSFEAYYRYTHNKIEFTQSVYSDQILLHKPQNVGKDFSLGLESNFNLKPFKWWELNLMGNMYQYKVEGTRNGRVFENESFNWGMRLNNNFILPYKSQLQLNGSYNSPTATSQGSTEGFVSVDAAVRKDFFDRKLSAVVQMRDLFATAKRESTSKDVDFYYHSKHSMKAPYLSFTLSYRINNYMPKKNALNRQQNEEMGGDEF